jgi:hypothetical protein
MKYIGINTTIKKNASTQDAVKSILKLAKKCAADPLARDIYNLAQHTTDPYRTICQFAYDAAYYEANPPGHQRVRSLQRTIVDQRASCTDYTVMIAAILLAGGEPVTIKLVSIDGNGYGHIYPMAQNGEILDIVPCQDQSGNEINLRDPKKSVIFGTETPHKRHILYKIDPMKLSELNGTNTIEGTNTVNGLVDFEQYTVDGYSCVAVQGTLIPSELNGTTIEPRPAGVTDEEYSAYLLAVALGDASATAPINGLKDFLAKRKAKRAQRKKSAGENKAARQERRASRRKKFGELFDVAKGFVQAKGEAIKAETQQALMDAAEQGIEPSDEGLRNLIESQQDLATGAPGAAAGESSMNLPLIAGAGILALLLLKK